MVATTTSVTTARASNGASAREAATVARRRMPRLGMRSGGLSPAGGRLGGGGEGLRSTSLDARTDVEASTKRASTKSTETPDFGFPGFPSFPDGFAPPSNPLESLPNYENLEKASKLAQDAFNTMVVENEDPLSGARRVAQAIEAAGAVLGDAISSGESEALLRDATDAFRQAVSEIQGAQSSSETTAGSPGRDSGAAAASSQRSDESLRRAAKLLRKYFERMGAAYVKLGQFIASSPTLFPKPIVDEFQGCLDDVPPLDYGTEISRVIQRELGGDKRVREVFSYIEETPVASASIAQVHRGTLRSTGQQVVLKVCKPGVGQSLRTDLDAVYLACRALELLDPSIEQRLGLSAIIQDAREAILAETDLLQEARNMRSFRSFLEKSAPTFDQVAIPEVIETLSTKKVLVMEELKGVSLSGENRPPLPSLFHTLCLSLSFLKVTDRWQFYLVFVPLPCLLAWFLRIFGWERGLQAERERPVHGCPHCRGPQRLDRFGRILRLVPRRCARGKPLCALRRQARLHRLWVRSFVRSLPWHDPSGSSD